MAYTDKVAFYGYTPVPRDPDVLFKDHPTALGLNPKQDDVEFKDLPLPDSPLVQKVKTFVKVCLNTIHTVFPKFNARYLIFCLRTYIGKAQRANLQPLQPRLHLRHRACEDTFPVLVV